MLTCAKTDLAGEAPPVEQMVLASRWLIMLLRLSKHLGNPGTCSLNPVVIQTETQWLEALSEALIYALAAHRDDARSAVGEAQPGQERQSLVGGERIRGTLAPNGLGPGIR